MSMLSGILDILANNFFQRSLDVKSSTIQQLKRVTSAREDYEGKKSVFKVVRKRKLLSLLFF